MNNNNNIINKNIGRRACSLSAVRHFGVVSVVSQMSGVTSGCSVEVSRERH